MIEGYIIDLLRTNDCVIVPGFGGFLTHKESSKILSQKREITPPKTGIIFNRGLDRNDGLLCHFLAEKTRETFRFAQAKIDETVNTWKKRLEEEKSLEIEGIGFFSLNNESKWQFAPVETGLQFHNSFGLTNVQLFDAEKVDQKKLKLVSHHESEIKVKKISLGWVYGGLAATAITILSFFIAPQIQTYLHPAPAAVYTNKAVPEINQAPIPQTENNSFLAAAAALQPETANNSIITSTAPAQTIENNTFLAAVSTLKLAPITINTISSVASPEPETTNTQQANNSVKASSGAYYVVGGSFLVQRNAKKFAKLLEQKGYKSQIVHNSNGFFNVSYVKEADSASAAEQLNKLKIQENQQAWILKW